MPASYAHLVDDAAVFPPGNAPLPQALAAHQAHRAAPYRDLLGPLVVSDAALPDLIELLRRQPGTAKLAVAIVVTGGAGAIEPAVRWATGAEELRLVGVELALRDEEDLPRNARRVTTVVEQLRAAGDLGEEVSVYVEPPQLTAPEAPASWLRALDEVAAMELHLKFRTGGDHADRFPRPARLASCIDAALDRELGFKCTAGLHHALRHQDGETGFEHHGFLNVLLATRSAWDGAPADEVARTLDEEDAGVVRAALEDAGEAGLVSARRWFRSFGSCSVLEPLKDLVELGLVTAVPVPPEEA